MEEIFEKANEIGLMLKETDEYKMYEKALMELHKNKESSELFEQYIIRKELLSQRRQQGDIIEKFENEEFIEIEKKIYADKLTSNFIEAQKEYALLLIEIQKNINNYEK